MTTICFKRCSHDQAEDVSLAVMAGITVGFPGSISRGGQQRFNLKCLPTVSGVFHNSWEMIARSGLACCATVAVFERKKKKSQGMAKAVQMLDSEMISLLDISALARQGNPSEELNLQDPGNVGTG